MRDHIDKIAEIDRSTREDIDKNGKDDGFNRETIIENGEVDGQNAEILWGSDLLLCASGENNDFLVEIHGSSVFIHDFFRGDQ
jgi:hypothetical protein